MQIDLFGNIVVDKASKVKKESLQKVQKAPGRKPLYYDASLAYNMVSVHIDRINITRHLELNRKSKHQIDNSESTIQLPVSDTKKTIKFSSNDMMSSQTQRKLTKAVKYLNFVTLPKKINNPVTGKDFNFKICFATCTLSSPQSHSDNELKKHLINQLLVEVKKIYHVNNYIWRIEKQTNGNAHFHFLFDKFIPHTELRSRWNRIQNKLGYVDEYTKRMSKIKYNEYRTLYANNSKKSEKDIKRAWQKGKASGWKNPNSTDIHSLLFINDIDSYLIKYLSKDEQNKGIVGRLWSCSQSLSNLTGARDIVDNSISAELNNLVNSEVCRHVKGEYYEIIFTDWNKLEQMQCYNLMSLLREWLIRQFNIERPAWMRKKQQQ